MPSRSYASLWCAGRPLAAASLGAVGVRRWSPPSCSRAECSRFCAPVDCPVTAIRTFIGGGRRLPSNGSWLWPATSQWPFGRFRRQERQAPIGRAFADLSDRLRRTDSDRLGSVNADRTVAAANRTGLVIVRGRRRSGLYPGAAGRRRDRRLLQPDHRRAGLDASRCGPVLGVQRRCRSPRHSDSQQRPCVHIRCNRRCQRAGRDGRHRRVVL